jgi:hypothetical protein
VVFTDEKTLNNLLTIVGAVTENGIRNVTAYDVSNPTDIVIELDHRVDVKLGSVSSVAGKIEFGKEVIARNMAESGTERLIIDLTTDAKAFVRPKEEPTTAPALTPTDGGEETTAPEENDTAGNDGEEYDGSEDGEEDYGEEAEEDYAEENYDSEEDYGGE